MEIKPGYKQTAVGLIPEEWGVAALDSVAQILDPQPDHRAPPEASGGEPYIGISDFLDDHTVNWDTTRKIISRAVDKQQSRFQVQPGNIIFGKIGTIGLPKFLPTVPFRFGLSANVLLIQPRIEPNFVMSWLRSETCQRAVTGELHSTSQAAFGINKMRRLMIPLPPEVEQHAIATVLSDVDGLLGGLDQLIAKKRDLKQAVMQQLLTGQTRLAGFARTNSQIAKTEVGVLPADWKVVQLSKLVDPTRGIRYGIVQPGDYDPNGRYMIRGQDYSEVKGWAKPSEVFRVSAAIEERYRNARVKTGDLIMTIVGYCGHVEQVPGWLDGANLTQTTARIAVRPEIAASVFCKYVLLSPTGRNQVAAYVKGAAQPGLNCGDVERFLLPLPSLPEQTAIATVLSDIDAELSALEARRNKTRALKQGMMQQLLTGNTRLV